MRRLLACLGLIVLLATPTPALASHSMAGGAACGDRTFDGVAEMTKGRTDGMVVTASYGEGCTSYRYRNLIGTGRGEAYGYAGQQENCERVGRLDVQNFYRYYFDREIDPSRVTVSCSPYAGPD